MNTNTHEKVNICQDSWRNIQGKKEFLGKFLPGLSRETELIVKYLENL